MHVENKRIPRSKFNFKLQKIIQELGLALVEGGLGHGGNPGEHLAPSLIPLYLKMKPPLN